MSRNDELPAGLRPTRAGGRTVQKRKVPTDVDVNAFYERMVVHATETGLLSEDQHGDVALSGSGFIRPFLDTCAGMLHVLSFYQGRIFNEGFLFTAQEQRSIFELAKMLGVHRRPALSSETHCALFAVDIPGDGLPMTVDAGMPVQSVPVKGGLPQIFETTAPVTVHPDWNEMTAMVESGEPNIRLLGASPGIVVRGTVPSIAAGAPILIRGLVNGERVNIIKTLTEIGRMPRRAMTVLIWGEPLWLDDPSVEVLAPDAMFFATSLSIVGADADDWSTLPLEEKLRYSEPVGGSFVLPPGENEWRREPNPGTVNALFGGSDGWVYAGLTGAGVSRSRDGGNWEPANAGIRTADVLCLSEDATGSLLAGTRTKGVYRSPDGGKTWNPLQGLSSIVGAWPRVKRVDARLPDTPVRCILPCTDSTGTRPSVLVGTDAGVFSFDQVSAQWRPVNEGLPGWEPGGKEALTSVRSLAVNARTGTIFAATDQGLFAAPRLNKPWTQRAVGGGETGLRCVALDPAGVAYAGLESGGLAVSADNGTNWVMVGETLQTPMSLRKVSQVCAVRDDDAGREWVFAVTNDGLWQSIDRGARWTLLSETVNSQRISAVCISSTGSVHIASPIDGVVDDEWPDFELPESTLELAKPVALPRQGPLAILEQSSADGSDVSRLLLDVEKVEETKGDAFGRTVKGSRLVLATSRIDAEVFSRRDAVCRYGPKTLSLPFTQIRHQGVLDREGQSLDAILRVADAFGRLTADRIELEDLPRSSVFLGQGIPAFEGRTIGVSGKRARVRCERAIALDAPGGQRTVQYSSGTVFEVRSWPVEAGNGQWTWTLRDDVGFEGGVTVDAETMKLTPAPSDALEVTVVRTAVSCLHRNGGTHLDLSADLDFPMDMASAKVLGNVVHAQHGFRVEEVLGNGDATAANQNFQLKQGPLSWSRVGNDLIPDIEINVSGNQWRYLPNLDEASGDAQAFSVNLDHDGNAWVCFGDGENGARIPSGSENVTARFRIGSGEAGNVEQGHIQLLRQRPPMVRRVTNIVPASGGTEAETANDLRVRLPVSLRVSRRVISRSDLEDRVRSHPGVRHVLAQHVWGGDHPVLCLTVSTNNAATGHTLTPSDPMQGQLQGIVESVCESIDDSIELHGHRSVPFNVGIDLLVSSTVDCDRAIDSATRALLTHFSFANRKLMQPVTKSEVMATLSRLDGILNASVHTLAVASDPDSALPLIDAHGARWSAEEGRVLAAEMLVLEPKHISISAQRVDS
jgi:uncharacterized phage protein gp47/JayE